MQKSENVLLILILFSFNFLKDFLRWKSLDKVSITCSGLTVFFFLLFLFSRDSKYIYNFKSLLYKMRF